MNLFVLTFPLISVDNQLQEKHNVKVIVTKLYPQRQLPNGTRSYPQTLLRVQITP